MATEASVENVALDDVNVIQIKHLSLSLQAVEDKIIVLMDEHRTGYECRNCSGTGKIPSSVVKDAEKQCTECEGLGVIKGGLVIPETAKSLPSTGVVVSMGPITPYMICKRRLAHFKASYEEDSFYITEVELELKSIPVQLGTRIVFSPHVGTMLPLKGNVKLKIMRVHEPLCILFGSDVGERDFIDYEVQQF
jgi:co-chaperonin GroES (HSP10)